MIFESAECVFNYGRREPGTDCFELEGQTHAQEQEDAEGPDVTLDEERRSTKAEGLTSWGSRWSDYSKTSGGINSKSAGLRFPYLLRCS